MNALGQYIKHQIEQQERQEQSLRIKFLSKLPENTFQAIYEEFIHDEFACGVTYNGIYYSEWDIYFASHDRDSDAEVLL
ncbi:hypothetical protein [Yersinia pseudotuberculosis]|uniref:hypothetical protein n=1 Tax=Yersinia pseudotuberculosis TaxID=633 RepID=UPI002B2D867F|nr:hypothetical protein YPSE1_27280 [Yersinia pseudotuberculosis]BET64855.1 hypothetical protein YPSE1_43140 [Yersinia pseudotuberculosis]